MGIFYDKVVEFEECIFLLSKNRTQESFAALILIDSLVDTYIHNYMSGSDFGFIPPKDVFKKANLSLEQRLKCLSKNQIIDSSTANSVKALHEYRNLFLHKGKTITSEIIPLAHLYFFLFEQLFVSIPVCAACLSDREKSSILYNLYNSCSDNFFEQSFRQDLVNRANRTYRYNFSFETFSDQLCASLMEFYNKIVDDMQYIIKHFHNLQEAITVLETECNAGRIEIREYGEPGDIQFKCTSSKTQYVLGKIRSLKKVNDIHLILQKYIEIYNFMERFYEPVFKVLCGIERTIQQNMDYWRGK